jgi:hypothetical protein
MGNESSRRWEGHTEGIEHPHMLSEKSDTHTRAPSRTKWISERARAILPRAHSRRPKRKALPGRFLPAHKLDKYRTHRDRQERAGSRTQITSGIGPANTPATDRKSRTGLAQPKTNSPRSGENKKGKTRSSTRTERFFPSLI